ncbi:MAG: hypothetical protein ACHQ6T_14325 [Myxococcota bacterium]
MNALEPMVRKSLVGHGLVVILLGLLIGFPYALVVTGSLAGEERAWRMAHLEGVLNGLLLIAVGAAGESLSLSARQARFLQWSLIATAYGNVLGAALGAAAGERGLTPAGPIANFAVYTLFMIAVAAVLAGIALAALGAFRRAR